MAAAEEDDEPRFRTLYFANGSVIGGLASEINALFYSDVVRESVHRLCSDSDSEDDLCAPFDTVSQGFDIYDIHVEGYMELYAEHTREAIDQYNENHEPQLEYVKIVKLFEHYRYPVEIFITFEAREKGTEIIRAYQLMIRGRTVEVFRLAKQKSPPSSSPEFPMEYSPELPAENSPEFPSENSPEFPAENSPESPQENSPESPQKNSPELSPGSSFESSLASSFKSSLASSFESILELFD